MTANDNQQDLPGSSALGSSLFAAGLAAIFVGERAFGAGTPRKVVSGIGVALVAASMGLRLLRVTRAAGERRRIERRVADFTAIGVTALVLYFMQSDAATFLFGGKPLSAGSPKLATALAALWPAVLVLGALPLLLVEISYASMARSARPEVGRIYDAALSGLGLAGALVFTFAVAFVAGERDKKWDLSYFRTARPGEATRKIVRALDQNVSIAYFFPPANEVQGEVKTYLDDLARESPKLEVRAYDQAVDPAKARELGVTGNGMVVVSRGARREQLSVGVELEQARTPLKSFDKEIQKRLLAIAKPGRTVYLTVGHGERLPDPASDTDKRFTIRALRQLMLDQSYTLRDLGAAEGLASDVPADAAVVMIVGPTKAFLPEEVAAIGRFVDKGGKLFIALDPEAGLEYKELLAHIGLAFSPVQLANAELFARRTYQPSDRINIVTGSFSSHPSVSTLGRLRAPLILPGVGALEEMKDKPKNASIDFSVHAAGGTWNDKNGNFEFDPKEEQKKGYELVAAVTRRKEGGKPAGSTDNGDSRSLVLADSDCISDAVLGSLGNAYFLLDGLKWLLGDEALAGETTSEVDVPIAHTKGQDAWWFYSTIFLAPALVIGAGALATRRKRARRRTDIAGNQKEAA